MILVYQHILIYCPYFHWYHAGILFSIFRLYMTFQIITSRKKNEKRKMYIINRKAFPKIEAFLPCGMKIITFHFKINPVFIGNKQP
jgi:hypothetical protein